MTAQTKIRTLNNFEFTAPDAERSTIYLIRPLTPEAQSFIDENIAEDAQFFADTLAVEPRYLDDILFAMNEAGLIPELADALN